MKTLEKQLTDLLDYFIQTQFTLDRMSLNGEYLIQDSAFKELSERNDQCRAAVQNLLNGIAKDIEKEQVAVYPKGIEKSYKVTVIEDKQITHVKRENEGFSFYELFGMITLIANDLEQQNIENWKNNTKDAVVPKIRNGKEIKPKQE